MTLEALYSLLGRMMADGVKPSTEAHITYDGFVSHRAVGSAYLVKKGVVVIAEIGEPVYHDDDRPTGAPSELEEPSWKPAPR